MQLAKFSGLTLRGLIDADMQRQFLGFALIHQAAKAAGVGSTFYPMAQLTHNRTVYDDECPSCIPLIMSFINQHLYTQRCRNYARQSN